MIGFLTTWKLRTISSFSKTHRTTMHIRQPIEEILDQAVELANAVHQPATAVLIWDGVSRGEHDLTDEFGVEARKRALAVTEVQTLLRVARSSEGDRV